MSETPFAKGIALVTSILVAIVFLIGAKVGKETTESDMYHRDYKLCVEKLPRNMDCVAKNIVFEEVESGSR